MCILSLFCISFSLLLLRRLSLVFLVSQWIFLLSAVLRFFYENWRVLLDLLSDFMVRFGTFLPTRL